MIVAMSGFARSWVGGLMLLGCSGATPTTSQPTPSAEASASVAPPLSAVAVAPASASTAPAASAAPEAMSLLDAAAIARGDLPPMLRRKLEDLCATDANTLDAGLACENLAALHGQGAMGVELDQQLGEKLFERARGKAVFACRGGEIRACSHIGLMNAMKLRRLDPKSEQAKVWVKASGPWLVLACEGRDPVSCDALAEILEVGRGIPRDPEAAKKVREREAELRATPKE